SELSPTENVGSAPRGVRRYASWLGNYCGPGGSGGAANAVDAACAAHDKRYGVAGAEGVPGALFNVSPQVIAADWALAASAFTRSYSNPVSGVTCPPYSGHGFKQPPS